LTLAFQPFAFADLNGDGHPDIARYDGDITGTTPANPIPRITNFLGQPDGSFAQSSEYEPYSGASMPSFYPFAQDGDPQASSFATDLNGDAKADEVIFQTPTLDSPFSFAQILMGNGDGTFTPTYDIFPFYFDNEPNFAHDLDGDGLSDMVSLIQASSSLQVYKGVRAPALQIELVDAVVQASASCGWIYPDVAASSDRTVSLFSSVSGVQLPASVTIASGALSAKFCYTLESGFNRRQVFDVDAQLNGDTATAYASATYVVGFTESISSPTTATIYPGQSVGPMTLALTPAAGYTSTVHLYCENLAPGDSCQFGSDMLSLSAAGTVSTTVTLVTGANSGTYGLKPTFTIVADDGNVVKRMPETIQLVGLNIYPLDLGFVDIFSPGTATYRIGVTGIAPLTFSCLGLPAGAACAFSDPVENTLDLTISVPSGLASTNFPIQVNVQSESFEASTLLSLGVISVSAKPATATDAWSFAGFAKTSSLTFQGSSNVTFAYLQVTCSLDVPGSTCDGPQVNLHTTAPVNATAALTLPSNATVGQHQLSLVLAVPGSTQTVNIPFYVTDFSGSLSNSAVSIPNAGTATITAALNATPGFVGNLSLKCQSEAVACSFSPSTTQLTGGTAQTVTITLLAPKLVSNTRHSLFRENYTPLLAGLLVPVLFVRRIRTRGGLLFLSLLICFSLIPACGGGGGSGGGSTQTTTNYTVTVSATEESMGVTRTLGIVTVAEAH